MMKRSAKTRRSAADRKEAKHLLRLLKAGGDTRVRKVKHVRAKVRVRSYENDLKLSIAMDRMIRDLSA